MSSDGYTDKQLRVLSRLPATTKTLSEKLGVAQGTIRSRIAAVNENEDLVDIKRRKDDDGKPVYYTDNPEHVSQISSKHKQTVTREANERLQELELDLARALKLTEETAVDVRVPTSTEDFVVHRSDTHIGQVVYDDRGRQVFNTEIALQREQKVTEAVLQAAEERRQHRDIETCHLLLGGDVVTNENIYDHQPFHIDRTLDEQILIGVEMFYEQILLLSEAFDRVQVVCQPGNHGEIRADGQSKKANADRIAYGCLDLLIRLAGPDNVNVIRSDATNYVNFEIRDWNAHLRHGQTLHAHVGTSAPGDTWKSHKLMHEFDLAYWGHYHEPLQHQVHGAKCIRSGSVCPPSDFEEKLGEWAAPAAFVHTVTDDERIAWSKPVQFD